MIDHEVEMTHQILNGLIERYVAHLEGRSVIGRKAGELANLEELLGEKECSTCANTR